MFKYQNGSVEKSKHKGGEGRSREVKQRAESVRRRAASFTFKDDMITMLDRPCRFCSGLETLGKG